MTKSWRLGLASAVLLLGGCETLSTWIPSIPAPDWSWLGLGHGSRKPGPLPAFEAKATAQIDWQVQLGGGKSALPSSAATTVAAGPADRQRRSSTGGQNWRIRADQPLSAGVGAGAKTVVVGTDKGDVRLDAKGSHCGKSKSLPRYAS